MSNLLAEARLALRGFRRQPVFTVTALTTLTLGIGATAVIFSVVNVVLLKPLPYPDSQQLVTVWDAARGGRTFGLTAPEYFDLRARSRTLERLSVYNADQVNVTGIAEPRQFAAIRVSDDFMPALGAQVVQGRPLGHEDFLEGAERVAVVTSQAARRHFASDASIVGRVVRVDGAPTRIVGVLDAEVEYPAADTDIWMPTSLRQEALLAGERSWNAVARLRPGVMVVDAERELTRIAAQLREEYRARFPAGANNLSGVSIVPMSDVVIGTAREAVLALLGGVALLLLIACANVANLQLARAEQRQRELALRMSLGASPRRLFRQLLVESTMLSVAGAGFGILIALWATSAIQALDQVALPRLASISVDGTVLGFTLAVAVVSGLLVGVAPAVLSSRLNLSEMLVDGGKGSTAGGGRRRFQRGLVVAEIALTVALLSTSGLLLRSFMRLQSVDLGIRTESTLSARVYLPEWRYASRDAVQRFYRTLNDDLAARGATAGTISALPLGSRNSDISFEQEGKSDRQARNADYRFVTGQYFRALGIPLLAGRLFADQEADATGLPVVISESMAKTYWPNENAVGRRIRLLPEQAWMTVVGIVADVHHRGPAEGIRATLYLPHAVVPLGGPYVARGMTIVVRTAGEDANGVDLLRASVRHLDGDLPISEVSTMEDLTLRATGRARVMTGLVMVFAVVGLLLAATGIYGLMSFVVAQRIPEMGIRMVLGATAGAVREMVYGESGRLVVMGIGLGIGGSIVIGRLISSLLHGVSPMDVLTLACVCGIVGVVGGAATHLPARRASSVDLATTLRRG